MRTIISIILVLFTISVSAQEIDHVKRLDYLKRHHLFVVKIEKVHLNQKTKIKEKETSIEKIINDNIKKCLETFWDLNDSIKYISLKEFKSYKKLFPDDIFLDFQLESFYAYHLIIPSKAISLNDVSPTVFTIN